MHWVGYVTYCVALTRLLTAQGEKATERRRGVEMGRRGNSKRETVAEEVRERARVVVIVTVRSFVRSVFA